MSASTCVSSSASTAARLAEECLARGRVEEALGIYRMISETDPANLPMRLRLGEVCALAGNTSEAVAVLSDVARRYNSQGKRTEAARALKETLKLELSDPDKMTDIASQCAACGLTREAETYHLKAAERYEAEGQTSRVEAAYSSAAAVAPANAELQTKLGEILRRAGKLDESYRAYIKAAEEFNRRGDYKAAQEAYGQAVNAALAGAESADEITHSPQDDSVDAARGAATVRSTRASGYDSRHDTAANSTQASGKAAGRGAAEQLTSGATGGLRPDTEQVKTAETEKDVAALVLPETPAAVKHAAPIRPGTEASAGLSTVDGEAVAGKIATAEILFELGRTDRAIALLTELIKLHPEDPRITEKLREIRERSGTAEPPTESDRETVRIHSRNLESEADQSVHAAGLKVEPESDDAPEEAETIRIARPLETEEPLTGPKVSEPNRSRHLAAAAPQTIVVGRPRLPAASSIALLAAETGTRVIRLRKRYLIGAVALITLSAAIAYLLMRSSQPNGVKPESVSAQSEPVEATSPIAESATETQPETSEQSSTPQERESMPRADQQSGGTRDTTARRQAQSAGDSRTAEADERAPAGVVRPTPPALGTIAAIPGTTASGPNVAPGGLARDLPAAPAPPTPTPTVRRSPVMAGGEVARRVEPVYPQAARAAHITGTVTVELSVNEQGNVVSAKATGGPGMLAGAAESAARAFKFKPMTADGVPIKSNRTLVFHFRE